MITNEENGIAMIATVVVSLVAMILSIVIVSQATHSLTGTAVDRARAQGIESAEAALGAGFQSIGGATSASALPCGPSAMSGSLSSLPTTETYTLSITYYATYPPSGSSLTCSAVQNGTSIPAAAQLSATGTTNTTGIAQKRGMDALVHLTPVAVSPAFDKALFSDAGFGGLNNPIVYGYVGNDANIYSNGDITCGNNFSTQGSVYSQGTFTGSNNCIVNVDVWSKTGFSTINNATIGHNVTVSQGSISMADNSIVNNQGFANGSVSFSGGSSIVHGYVANASGLADPPKQAFPAFNFVQADWTAAGYSIVTDNNCASNGVYADISNMSTATNDTVISTTCALTWANNSVVNVRKNLAIFSTAGFTMKNNAFWGTADGASHNIDFIVPYNAATMPCTSPGISLLNNTNFSSQVAIFFYTPCQMNVQNNTTGYGQVYAGSIAPSNNFTEHYVPVSVPGGNLGTTSLYSVGIGYEREVVRP